MRGACRRKLIAIGGTAVVVALAVAGTGALMIGRLGWENYWGGFVFAPFALVIAGLFVVKVIKGPARQTRRRRR